MSRTSGMARVVPMMVPAHNHSLMRIARATIWSYVSSG